ncbi:MAG: NmrA family NAD(P)-binding protein [Armatimonadetes bacterium]|nr:NmrA family NAD(P)-binding protein [Armatimonadota bacterium]
MKKNNILILVTGAAGKTGAPVVEQMLNRGFPVRALVRRNDERSARLEALGAEIIVGDLHDLKSMRTAMQNVKRVYFVYPPQGELLVEATTIVAVAARDAGVEVLVNMSQISAREDSKSPLARQHWLSENIFDWADIDAVHVRPTFFAENLLMFGAATVATEGKLYLPYGTEKHAPVAAADIARVVVGILADPAGHVGERYIVTGPRNLSLTEIAGVLSQELGNPVEYVDLPVDAWGEVLAGVEGMTDSLVTHLKAVAVDHQNGIFRGETDVVERIGGQPSQALDSFIREHRAVFGAAEAVVS